MRGPVVAGILAVGSAEDVLRHGFEAAADRGVALHVQVAGAGVTADPAGELPEMIERWAGKYPAVPVTVSVRAGLDAVIVLAAATHGSDLVVVAEPRDARETAIVRALARRARCPLTVLASHPAATS